MSLDFSFKNIADYKSKVFHPADENRHHPVTETMIWATMIVDIGRLTEANAGEFYWRMNFARRLDGVWGSVGFGEGAMWPLTLADVKDHVGLITNVVTITNRKKWLSKWEHHIFPRDTGESARVQFDEELAKRMAKIEAKSDA